MGQGFAKTSLLKYQSIAFIRVSTVQKFLTKSWCKIAQIIQCTMGLSKLFLLDRQMRAGWIVPRMHEWAVQWMENSLHGWLIDGQMVKQVMDG